MKIGCKFWSFSAPEKNVAEDRERFDALLEQLHISQSTLSYHMRILCDSGIVSSRTEGKWTHYRICPEGSKQAQARLLALTRQSPCPSGGCQCGK